MEYKEFLKSKKKSHIHSGFDCEPSNKHLKPFQRLIVKKALKAGRYAIFADTGLGKTIMQLSWASEVVSNTKLPVLILAPLAVVAQTKREAEKFGIGIKGGIEIINYDQIDNIDCSHYSGVVLDESSILKSFDGKTSNKLIDLFAKTPYKLCCSATPSPNDHTELGMHSHFLGAMSYHEMLAMYFVHDGGETSKWRLRKHADSDFWNFVLSWSIAIDNPSTFGFTEQGYDLPEVHFIEHFIDVNDTGLNLFGEGIVSATDLHRDLKKTFKQRIEKVSELVNNSDDQWIIWGLQNFETTELSKAITDSVNVQGSDKAETKAKHLNGFADNDFKVLITKAKIASFGMNYQNCNNMVFMSYDFGFEAFYQAVRRCYRFGQTKEVNVHILIPKTQSNVRRTILEKEAKHKERIKQLSIKSYQFEEFIKKQSPMNDLKTNDYWLMNGDCVDKAKQIPDNYCDLAVFSPPFSELYVYSDKHEDMGNSANYNEFEQHFKFLIPEISRNLKPGRICAVHCMDLPIQKGKEGYIGLRDFSGMLIKWFQDEGFIYHAKVTIWKNPVTEMQRTKALGLLHKTIKKDSVMSRVGIPDYVLFFRNAGDNEVPITHQSDDTTKADYLPVDLWQKYASPVWLDVDYKRTLQYTTARDGNDEKHICPLQLDTIERILHLYSNEGETVASYFGGIGSEGFSALKMGRKSVSIELKESYFKVNAQNHKNAILGNSQMTAF
jgi:DNA modification methylase